MSLPDAVIDALVASGCTREQLAAAMKAANADTDARMGRKREVDAARKRRQREREAQSHALSRGQTVTDVDSADSPSPKKETSPTPPKEKQEPPTKENTPLRGVQKKASRLPEGWVLPDEWRTDALAAGLPEPLADLEAAKMLDWSRSSRNGAKLDWRAVWRNWCREAATRLPRARGSPARPPTAQELLKARREAFNHDEPAPNGPYLIAAR